MKLRTSLLGFFIVVSTAAVGCVIKQAPAAAPAAPAATAPATTPATPATTPATAATTPAPVADDPNADITADADDPASGTEALPKQDPVEPPPPTPGLAEETTAGVVDGRPKGIEPGAPVAFWIWRNAAGVWKLRTTTAKLLHDFRGRVKGVQAPIGKVRPSRTEFADRIARGTGGEVIFRFKTKGHIDGFDFRAPAKACVRFDLQLDSGAAAKKVFIGKDAVSPKTNHFILCPAK